MTNFDKLFEQIYFESQFNQIIDDDKNNDGTFNLNWNAATWNGTTGKYHCTGLQWRKISFESVEFNTSSAKPGSGDYYSR